MNITYLLNTRFTSMLLFLFTTLQLTACSTGEPTTTNPGYLVDPYPPTATYLNHAAIITGDDSGSVTKDIDADANNLLKVGGALAITEIDADEDAFVANSIDGAYGSLTISDDGIWNYSADNNQTVIQNLTSGESLSDRLTVSSVDGTQHTVVITINGINEVSAPITIIDPVVPDEPVTIIDPVVPDEPVTIIDPVVPDEPVTIIDPVVPDEPVTIIDPVVPDEPVTIIDPVVPDEPVTIIDPVVPDEPVTIIDPVVPDTSIQISLDWIAPSAREDDTPLSLSAIAGYKVYYGNAQGQYPNSVHIDDGSADSYAFTDLPTGTYYFVVTTYDTDGRESQYSTVIIKTI